MSLPAQVLLAAPVVILLARVVVLLVVFLGGAGSRRVILGSGRRGGFVRVGCSLLAVCCGGKRFIKDVYNYLCIYINIHIENKVIISTEPT